MFGKKRTGEIAERIGKGLEPERRRPVVWRRLRRNAAAAWSIRILGVLVFIAMFADFLANEKPLYCRIAGETYFPVVRQYAVDLGLAQWDAGFVQTPWSEQAYESVIFAPIPYSAGTIDRGNMNCRSPFGDQRVSSRRFRHWLGTDDLGRDVLAGMIRGTRIALSVGMVAMGIALIIGVFFGALAGYYGDRGLRVSVSRLVLNIAGIGLGLFYAFIPRQLAFLEGPLGWELLKSLAIIAVVLTIFNLIAGWMERRGAPFSRSTALPLDLLVMRLIEIINSIPGLLLLLSMAAIVKKPSILFIMVLIGMIGWTGIARFTRAELLRIRNQEYIEAARALGFSDRRILFRHALPNALTPILISLAFGIAGAVLLEAFLSFLGIGLPAESVSWGTLLNQARYTPKAWWLALFPGLAIFITVTVFNLIGEGLTEAIRGKEMKPD